jgi:hypothetical protein
MIENFMRFPYNPALGAERAQAKNFANPTSILMGSRTGCRFGKQLSPRRTQRMMGNVCVKQDQGRRSPVWGARYAIDRDRLPATCPAVTVDETGPWAGRAIDFALSMGMPAAGAGSIRRPGLTSVEGLIGQSGGNDGSTSGLSGWLPA